jgi:transposase
MNHRFGADRAQVLLLPEAIEDYVAADNPVRLLDAFVASLDLHALGFAKAIPAYTGAPPYDPGDLLRLYLYGYLQRIRSSRALERECHRNLELIWLLRQLAPDFKTIADFRRDHRAGFKAVHRQFHLRCHELKLFGGELVAIDGTKLAAVNARDRNFNEKKLQELLARADARLAEYLQQLDAGDTAEGPEEKLTRLQLEEKIAALREKKEGHEELLARLQDEDEKQISTTDADARKMHAAQGTVIGYNAQSAVDARHKLIVAEDVTNEGPDVQQLARVALEAKETLGVESLEVVADPGYYNNAEVSRCVERGITPYLRKADTSANSARGLYAKKDFTYDKEKDVYLCPAGAELTHRFNNYELGRSLRYYRAKGCAKCPLKEKCTRNKGNRTITREEDEHLMEAMAARVQAQPQKMKLRKALVEHPFGTIKRWFGYTYFLVKGLENVRAEWTLITLAYNLKRVLHIVSFAELMSAMQKRAAMPA